MLQTLEPAASLHSLDFSKSVSEFQALSCNDLLIVKMQPDCQTSGSWMAQAVSFSVLRFLNGYILGGQWCVSKETRMAWH